MRPSATRSPWANRRPFTESVSGARDLIDTWVRARSSSIICRSVTPDRELSTSATRSRSTHRNLSSSADTTPSGAVSAQSGERQQRNVRVSARVEIFKLGLHQPI
jgi:hypothetical protein